MKSKTIHAISAALVFVVFGIASLWATGNLNIGSTAWRHTHDDCGACPGEHHHAGHTQGLHGADCPSGENPDACGDHTRHNHPISDNPTDLDTIMTMNCEHRLIVDCDDCRYEVGLVKIGPQVGSALLETETVSKRNMAGLLRLTGRIELDQTRTFEVAPAAAGRIVTVEKLLGQKVKAGDVLAVIQSAELGQAKADWLEAKAALQLAQSTFDREKQLYEKQIASLADFLTAQNELSRSDAALAAAEKKLDLFGLDADRIAAIEDDKTNGRFAQLLLRAPADGIIIEQNLVAGKLVDNTQTLYTITDLSNLWVWCDLYERDLPRIHEGLGAGEDIKASIRVAAFPNEVFEGTLDLVESRLNPATRTIRVRLSLANPDGMLKLGMFVEARIAENRGQLAVAVPKAAVMSDAGKSFVFQQVKDDLWLRRNVITGRQSDGYVEILGGLSPDARVVAKGAFMLKSDLLREKMGAGCAH